MLGDISEIALDSASISSAVKPKAMICTAFSTSDHVRAP